ncbi:hypothetical protein QBC37DRAFT_394219 [Rhypophila decipiens]|uniref:Uncharacterized protein n=1 Tax=Rhypophila decipiens TaxID=261697 RepID=A0AAN7BDY9_9PEZI|nr:hypothetical protein QBC37DRAFT_394219 [Rhypophila decipiens]
MSSPPKATDDLNPSMTYRPPPPPTTAAAARNTTYLRIDSSTQDPQYRTRVRVSKIIRFGLALLAFGPLLGLSIVGRMGRGREFTVPIFYELLVVIVWQLVHLPQFSTVARGVSRRLPRMSLSIGDASWVVGGGGEEEDELLRGYSQPPPPPKKNLASLFTTAVDFFFGVTLIVFGALWTQAPCPYYYCWNLSWGQFPSIVLTIILGCLMVMAAFFSLYKTYHTMAFEFSLYKDGTVQPISLGRTTEVDVSSRREPVSISA